MSQDRLNDRNARPEGEFAELLAEREPGLFSVSIGEDLQRFRDIVKGKVREELRDYLTTDELLGRQGQDTVTIPIDGIEIPHFTHGSQDEGVGQGEGEPGDQFGDPQDGEGGAGEAGDAPGEHGLEVRLSIDELADMLGEELNLPRIQHKGTDTLESIVERYNRISRVGPDSLRHNKRTLREALLRELSEGTYDPDNPELVPIRDDFRYRAPSTKPKQKTNAAIIYIMDISGSMGEEQKQIARITSFWINAWLDRQYQGCQKSFIVHDTEAREVDQETFFRLRESGGTHISSAYEMTDEIIRRRFPPDEWNIYIFQFSDGDNWDADNRLALEILGQRIMPYVNQFAFALTPSSYGSGDFYDELEGGFPETEEVVLTKITERGDIPDAIKDMLGGGR